MYQNYVVEITKDANGEMAHDVTWHWDDDADKALLKAESKYHEVLSRAAVSDKAEHSAILFTEEGFPVEHKCYKHTVTAGEPVAE